MNRFVEAKMLRFQSLPRAHVSHAHTQYNTIAGSTLLATVERLAFNVLSPDTNTSTQNIGTCSGLLFTL